MVLYPNFVQPAIQVIGNHGDLAVVIRHGDALVASHDEGGTVAVMQVVMPYTDPADRGFYMGSGVTYRRSPAFTKPTQRANVVFHPVILARAAPHGILPA